MKQIIKTSISILIIISALAGCNNNTFMEESAVKQTTTKSEINEDTENFISTYKVVAEASDWGAVSTKAIIELKGEIEEKDLCSFNVKETNSNAANIERTVTNVYLSDEKGGEVTEPSMYITIEMSVDPIHGTLFYYDTSVRYNIWNENYKLVFTPINPQNDILKNLSVSPKYTERITPQADKFQYSKFKYNDITMNYAEYSPAEDNEKNPLVIWLHGQGEGGDDVTKTLLGNKVTALADDEIQNKLGGAYVVAPQCPTYWPETSVDGGYNGERPTGKSCYTETLKALIDEIIALNSDIDTNRIYIGGCSMGGYMTINMIMEYPDFFATAFPICEYYPDSLITNQQIVTLANIPLWFTYCEYDNSVNPSTYAEATVTRLNDANAENLHVSVFNDVHDTTGKYFGDDGNPYVYDPHWSWIYALNDKCFDGDVDMWKWIAEQNREIRNPT